MHKLNFDYILTDNIGNELKKGHINYSVSHFIYALYQKTYVKATPYDFWQMFHNTLTLSNMGKIYHAFAYSNPKLLNSKTSKGLMNVMHAFGYFAFRDILGREPIFYKSSNKGQVYLVDSISSQAMRFAFSIPQKVPTSKTYSKLFLATFTTNGTANYSLVNEQGTFSMKIVDPEGVGQLNGELIDKYKEKKDYVLTQLAEPKVFDLDFNSVTLRVHISKKMIDTLETVTDCFTDGEIYIYVEEKLKISEYIYFVEEDRLVLSLTTASLVKLETEKYNGLKNGDISVFGDEEILQLKQMGFIVPCVNEYEQMLKKRRKIYQLDKNSKKLGFTILTTTVCNARCTYCYEKGVKQICMDEAMQQKISDLICFDPQKKVHISWFGGEPLLNIHAINYITQQMRKHNIRFTESIITNGYLIDKCIESLLTWNITNVQITLDGVNEVYNNIKNYIYKDGSKSPFEKVISNIKILLDNNIRVAIRLNFDKVNYLDILDAIDYIHKEFGNNSNLRVYAHHIFGDSELYHSSGENLYYMIFQKLIDCGYICSLSDIGLKNRNFYCFVTNKNHRVIAPDGSLYICEHITKEGSNLSIGNISEGILDEETFKRWTNISYPYKKCSTCKFVFFCQGGCKNEKNNGTDACCIPYIDCLNEIIQYYYNSKKEGGVRNGDN